MISVFASTTQAGIVVFSQGMSLPETITPAPTGFGSYGGQYFIADPGINGPGTSTIWVVPQTGGSPTSFQTVNDVIRAGLFLPTSFGGGQLGAVYALDGSGQIVAALKVGTELQAFDPRGLYFPNSNTLLINDGSDPILSAAPSDFGPPTFVPEPSSLVTGFVALVSLGLVACARRRLRRSGEALPAARPEQMHSRSIQRPRGCQGLAANAAG
jgi:hypothetical protein